jgi:hypothetical protein
MPNPAKQIVLGAAFLVGITMVANADPLPCTGDKLAASDAGVPSGARNFSGSAVGALLRSDATPTRDSIALPDVSVVVTVNGSGRLTRAQWKTGFSNQCHRGSSSGSRLGFGLRARQRLGCGVDMALVPRGFAAHPLYPSYFNSLPQYSGPFYLRWLVPISCVVNNDDHHEQ